MSSTRACVPGIFGLMMFQKRACNRTIPAQVGYTKEKKVISVQEHSLPFRADFTQKTN
jgi:hypothetical protein